MALAVAKVTIPEVVVLGVEAVADGCGGRSGGHGGRGSYDKANTGYYSAAEWEKLSYEEHEKIRKGRDKKGGQGGCSKRNISELSTKQLTTALISSMQKVSASDDSSEKTVEMPKQSNQAGNAFGGREGAKRQKNSESLAAMLTSTCVAAYRTSARRLETTSMKTIASITNVTTNTARNELDSHAHTCALG